MNYCCKRRGGSRAVIKAADPGPPLPQHEQRLALDQSREKIIYDTGKETNTYKGR